MSNYTYSYEEVNKAFKKLKPIEIKETILKQVKTIKGNIVSEKFYNISNGKTSDKIKNVTTKKDYTVIDVRSNYFVFRYNIRKLPDIDGVVFEEYALKTFPLIKEGEKINWEWRGSVCYLKNKEKWYTPTTYYMPEELTNSSFPILVNDETLDEIPKYIKSTRKKSYKDILKNSYLRYFPGATVNYINNVAKMYDGIVGINGETFEELSKPISELFGGNIKSVSGSKVVNITKDIKSFLTYINYKEPKRKLKKEDDEYLNITLPAIKHKKSYDDAVISINKVRENLSVLRVLSKSEDSTVMKDIVKVFITNKTSFAYKVSSEGTWHKISVSSNAANWNYKLIGFNPKNVEGTMLQYFGEIIDSIPNNLQAKTIWTLLTTPIVEKLLKTEFKNFIFYILEHENSKMTVNRALTHIFGKIDTKKKTLYQQLGVNKYQFDYFCKKYNNFIKDATNWDKEHIDYTIDNTFSAKDIKYILYTDEVKPIYTYLFNVDGYKDISYLDNKTFDTIINYSNDEDRFYKNYYIHFLQMVHMIYGLNPMCNICGYIELLIDDAISHGYRSMHPTEYHDYLVMVNELRQDKDIKDINEFKPYFDKNDLNSITNMHNLILELYDCKKNKAIQIEFENSVKRIKAWEFEDDEYIAITPSQPKDLTREGIELHHCVASYIERVAKKQTNIMFIRQKSDITKSFFTVEITNDKNIQQIHGMCNCNIDTVPGLDKFVNKWKKAKKLKLNNINKVR